MNRNNLIPKVTTEDLDPKEPWNGEEEAAEETIVEETAEVKEIPSQAAIDAIREEQKEQEEERKKKRSLWTKALLAFVIVAGIVGIGILLPLKVIPGATSMIASVFNSKDDSSDGQGEPIAPVAFTAEPSAIESGGVAKISWTGPVRTEGVYTLSYTCVPGTTIVLVAADGSKPQVACGKDFKFLSIDNTMTLAISSESEAIAQVPITFAYVSAAGSTSTLGVLPITVTNGRIAQGQGGQGGQTGTPEYPNQQIIVGQNGQQGGASSGGGLSGKTGSVTSGPGKTVFPSTNPTTGSTGSVTSGPNNTVFPSTNPTTGSIGSKPSTGTAQGGGTTQGGATQQSGGTQGGQAPARPTTSGNPGAAPAYYGRPDLAVRIIATGRIDAATNAFVPTTSVAPGERAAAQFEIVNVGTAPSGQWRFRAQLPTADGKVYESPVEPSLSPGGSIIFTLGFDGIAPSQNASLLVAADADGRVGESNEGNNVGQARFAVTGGSTGVPSSSGADLSASFVAIGTVRNGAFVETNNIYENETVAIRFRARNAGGSRSGVWNFTAIMRGDDDEAYTYKSVDFYGFAPGESATYTVTFDNVTEGENDFVITLDPDSRIQDANRSNNRITAWINVR